MSKTSGPLSLVFLGTTSQAPSRTRNVSAAALRLPSGLTYLIDCGEATQHQARRAHSVRLSRVGGILLTHMHGDHVFGLPGLLCSINQHRAETAAGAPPDKRARRGERAEGGAAGPRALLEPLRIAGTAGVVEYVRTSLSLSRSFLGYPLEITEMHPKPAAGVPAGGWATEDVADGWGLCPWVRIRRGAPGKEGTWFLWDEGPNCAAPGEESALPGPESLWTSSNGVHRLRAAPIEHSIFCVGYSLEEPEVAGNIRMEAVRPILDRVRGALAEAGIRPAERLLGNLKRGEVVDLPDGTKLDPTDPALLSPSTKGRHLVWLGDTSALSPAAHRMARGADVLVHEATNAATSLDGPGGGDYDAIEAKAKAHGHSTPRMAGAVAREANVSLLCLTHFSARYVAGPDGLGTMQQIAAQAEGPRADVDRIPDVGSAPHFLDAGATRDGILLHGPHAMRRISAAPLAPHIRIDKTAPIARVGRTVCAADFLRVTLDFRRDKDGHILTSIDFDPDADLEDPTSSSATPSSPSPEPGDRKKPSPAASRRRKRDRGEGSDP